MPLQTGPIIWQMPRLTTFRKDLWQSWEAAGAAFRKNPLMKGLDERVIKKSFAHCLRPTPTILFPAGAKEAVEGAVTLTTPKHQESFSIMRPNYNDAGVESFPSKTAGGIAIPVRPLTAAEQLTHPDLWDAMTFKSPFYKPEARTCLTFLPHLRPSVFWIHGGNSFNAAPSERGYKMTNTGTGWSDSGGARL